MSHTIRLSSLAALLLLGACTTMPNGPSEMVLPGTGKSFDDFRVDDVVCRQFASSQMNGTSANQAATDSGVSSAAVGTLLGAAAGAAINGHRGAGVGAGAGLLIGSSEGSNAARYAGYSAQKRYDNAYQQCMYAKGNRIPVSGRMVTNDSRPAGYTNVPPPNTPPPPPPGAY